MKLAGEKLSSFSIVIRDYSAKPLFSLYHAFVGRLEIRTKNLVSDIDSLMRAFVVVIREPFMVDMIKLDPS